jgi:hypothetical protein
VARRFAVVGCGSGALSLQLRHKACIVMLCNLRRVPDLNGSSLLVELGLGDPNVVITPRSH